MGKVSDENLGAWLVKCDPTAWDLAHFIADGGEWIDHWSVRKQLPQQDDEAR